MENLGSMRNIGRAIEEKLKSVGITSAEELKRVGVKEAFLRLKLRYPNVCLVHLYSLAGAVNNIDYNQLPEETKKSLKAYNDGITHK